MIITFECPSCQAAIEADNTLFGTIRSCPGCDVEVEVPAAHVGPGVEIGGFKIEDRLGKGGMGEVFLAEQLSMGRLVALKVLPPEMTTNKEAVERFLHEAKMSARLEHPNIVTVLDAGEDCNFFYLAMQYVEGCTLDDRVKKERTLPEKEVLEYGRKVLGALDHAWGHHHILHRDIKPANVMLDKYGEVKLLDMGLAKDILEDNQLTISGTIVGTPYYMSPEQAKTQKDLDFRSDLYSVGATLYHLLTGAPPFEGDSVVTILTQHVLEEVPPIQTRNPEVSDACARLMDVMLAKNPKDRYDSYEDAISDFGRVLSGQMPTAKAPPAKSAPKKKKGIVVKRKESDLGPPKIPTAAAVTLDSAPSVQQNKSSKGPLIAALASVAAVGLVAAMAIGTMMFVFSGESGGDKPPPADPDPDPIVNVIPEDDDDDDDDGGEAIPPDGWGENQPPDKDEMTRRAERVAREVKEIEQFRKDNPLDFDEAMRRYQDLAALAAGTPHHATVMDNVRQLRQDRRQAIAKVMARLADRVKQKVAAGETEEAAKMLMEYDGPFADITESERHNAARTLLDRKRSQDEEAHERRHEAVVEFEEGYLEICDHLVRQDFDGAREKIAELRRNSDIKAVLKENEPLLALADQIAEMDNVIMASFDAHNGRTMPVRLKKGKEELAIGERTDGKVKAFRLIRDKTGKVKGRFGKSFTYEDLSADEKVRRITKAQGDARHAMKAILFVEIGKADSAIKTLSKMESEACVALASHIGNAVPLGFRHLLRAVPLPEDETDMRVLNRKLSAMTFSETKKEEIRHAGRTFLRRHGEQNECDPYRPLAERLATLGEKRMPFDEDPFKKDPDEPVVKDPGDDSGIHNHGKRPEPVEADFVDPKDLGQGADVAIELQKQTVKIKKVPLEVKNSLGMHFRLIPVAANWGAREQAPDRIYYMGKHEVTQQQWQAIFRRHRFQNPSPRRAADNMVYEDIQRFIDKLCEREEVPKGTYRLPTEAEWMYACQAGTRSKYFYGDDVNRFKEFANYLDASAPTSFHGVDLRKHRDRKHSDGNRLVARVGSYKPNPWGLHDMYGNVWEYVADVNEHGNFHSVKGGSWLDTPERLTTTGRLMVDSKEPPNPDVAQPYGFRLVFEPPKKMIDDPDKRVRPRDRRPFQRFPRP